VNLAKICRIFKNYAKIKVKFDGFCPRHKRAKPSNLKVVLALSLPHRKIRVATAKNRLNLTAKGQIYRARRALNFTKKAFFEQTIT